MRPMPFWPSLEPWANDTPVQVGDERAADPPRRRLIALRRLIERRIADDELQRQEQQGSGDKAEQRREQQRVADLGRLGPIDAGGAVLSVHQRIGDADADDRADQRMRARCGQAEIPGPEIPDDRRHQQREHHGEAGAAPTCRINSTGSSEMMPNATAPLDDDDAEEIEEAGPDHGDRRRQRVCVDHRGDGIGGVVEAVDELEAERDQQSDEQKKIWQVGRRLHAGRFDVRVQAIRHEQHAGAEHTEEQDQCKRIGRGVELRFVGRPRNRQVPCSGAVISVMESLGHDAGSKGKPPCVTGV